jgi:type IV pilus assembly protein PilB
MAFEVPLLKRAPISTYRANGFLPVRRDGERTLVVFADPANRQHLELARKHFGHDLIVGIGARKSVMAAIGRAEKDLLASVAVASPAVDGGGAGALVNGVLDAALANRVSDIHFEPGRERLRIRFRQDGVMVLHDDVPNDKAVAMIGHIKMMAGADIAERRRHQDGRIQYETWRGTVDIRVSIYATIHGDAAAQQPRHTAHDPRHRHGAAHARSAAARRPRRAERRRHGDRPHRLGQDDDALRRRQLPERRQHQHHHRRRSRRIHD